MMALALFSRASSTAQPVTFRWKAGVVRANKDERLVVSEKSLNDYDDDREVAREPVGV